MITINETSAIINHTHFPANSVAWSVEDNGVLFTHVYTLKPLSARVPLTEVINESTDEPFATAEDLKTFLKENFKVANRTGQSVSLNDRPFGYASIEGTGVTALAGGTTGGAGGAVEFVNNMTELKAALVGKNSTAKIIVLNPGQYLGPGDAAGSKIYVGSNKTIIGTVGSEIVNAGFKFEAVNNVILRNLRIRDVINYAADNDCISIKEGSHHIWIDHCELSAQRVESDVDWELYDGLLDISNASDYITISHCHFHDAHKANLLGNTNVLDVGFIKVTAAFNKFERISERAPWNTYGRSHFFNNYYVDNDGTCMASTQTGIIRADNNYFTTCLHPMGTFFGALPQGQYANAESNYIDPSCGEVDIQTAPSNWSPATEGHYQFSTLLKPVSEVPEYVSKNIGQILSVRLS